MMRRTVVGWNGSEPAEAALEWALRRSRDAGSTVELLDVVDRDLFLGDPRALDHATTQEETRFAGRVEALTTSHPGALSGHTLLVGDPLELLAQQAGADTLVVVGTAHRAGPRGRYGWSLGSRLATGAGGAVAIVPAEPSGRMRGRSGVVVGIDGSDIGRVALDVAATEAEALGQPLIVVHCWQQPLAEEPLIVPDDEFVDSQQAAHQELLDDHVQGLAQKRPGLEVRPVLLRQNPVSGLRSRSQDAFLLVVGSRRLTGWRRAWLGSVSHGLILDLAAPTMVVGPEITASR
ncbi:universal stress protein [Leifsonia sp. AG29]|uniref:universal stress protein n=1 Tax=Leifsonia sp. AG29 TaxID=2598860 RepID=UPI00131C57C6|nr:universal stress protein [Leifsonia sp. AG29]